nr:hypothetical protein [Cohaesibacter sp. ES.047]
MKQLANIRHDHALAAHEKLHSEHAFKLQQALSHGGLRNMNMLARFGDAAKLTNAVEYVQTTQFGQGSKRLLVLNL